MQAVRICSSSDTVYSVANPAPPSTLLLDHDVPLPKLSKPGQVLVRVHATSVTRDELTWPETYVSDIRILGHDASGTVVEVSDETFGFHVGDEVYGMINLHEGCSWAEYVVAEASELALKPKSLSWAESVTVPMSGLTAWEALFDKAGIPEPELAATTAPQSLEATGKQRSLLVTGASGMVGTWVIQLAALTPLRVTAATSSNARNKVFLQSLGADEVMEYDELYESGRTFDIIIDTAGGSAFAKSWPLVADDGIVITVESSNFDIDKKARPAGKEHARAMFFIVTPSGSQLAKLTRVMELGLGRAFVAEIFPLAEAGAAYEKASGRLDRRGKVVLSVHE
ncbi:putative zinc-binding oxidoreductase [Paramyrothecium foliicola]|nr:putative zinc-binding oxidoreductase [Paramyrothecium foliicola]